MENIVTFCEKEIKQNANETLEMKFSLMGPIEDVIFVTKWLDRVFDTDSDMISCLNFERLQY